MNIIHYVVGRQVGKTTKIIDMVKNSISDINLIVTHNDNMRRHFSDALRHRDRDNSKSIYNDKNGGTRIIPFRNLQFELEHFRPNQNQSINVYFDELICCVEKTVNKDCVTNFIKEVESKFDHIHSNIIAVSTPMRKYRLKDFTDWSNGKYTIDNHIFENALLSTDYVSGRLPNSNMNEDKIREVVAYKLTSGEPMERISLEHFAKFI